MPNDEGMTKLENPDNDFYWADDNVLRVQEEADAKPVYDLEERTARCGEAIIDFAKKIPPGPVTERINSQLVGAATSVGANYHGADDAVSKREFPKCIGTWKKEARETKHFLRMSAHAVPKLKSQARDLWLEARALHLIFSKIWRSGQRNLQSADRH